MSFHYLSGLLCFATVAAMAADQPVLRVCADPNNLPFSNEQGDGFENKLAELLAESMNAKLEYAWWSERKSLVRNTLEAGRCDVLIGVPSLLDSVDATEPYYRSTYVFVSRRDRNLQISSLSDPRLNQWKIGIHVVGDDYAPPAAALARRGITQNVVGYSLFGEYAEPNPPLRLIDAVANGDVDVAIVWGPFAGYFAKVERTPVDIVPVSPSMFLGIPFVYGISAGVKKGNEKLKAQIERVLEAKSALIRQILSQYGIPQVN